MNELNPTTPSTQRTPALQAAYDETHRLILVVSQDLARPDVSCENISDAISRLIRLNHALFLVEGNQSDSVTNFIKALQGEF